MYAVNDRDSFEIAKSIREKLIHACGSRTFPIILVGNKIDLKEERQVSRREAEQCVRKWQGSGFEEITCKSYEAVSRVFAKLIEINEIRCGNYHPPKTFSSYIASLFRRDIYC
jgi:GTPase SAR1 family protein